jgi:hypothetical protein
MGNIRHSLEKYALGDPELNAWDDLRFPAVGINLSGGGGEPTRDPATGYLEFPATGTSTIVVHPQMPHKWREGSVIVPHTHWRKKTAGAGNVVWRLEYEWTNIWDIETDVYTTENASTVPDSRDDGSAKRHLVTPFLSQAMTGFRISVMGVCRLSRLGNDGGDTYAGVVQLKEFDIHYMVDGLGSDEVYDKY